MSKRSRAALLIALLLALPTSVAGDVRVGVDGIRNPITANAVGSNGIANVTAAAASGTPCAAGQLDFSDVTGCNLTLLMVGL